MKVVWTTSARQDRNNIIEFIAADNISAALELDMHISRSVVRLMEFPKLGKTGRITGTREFVLHEHYVLVYEVSDTMLIILNVLHTSQKWPPLY